MRRITFALALLLGASTAQASGLFGPFVPPLTTGSIAFKCTTGPLCEDNANLFWDDTAGAKKKLGLGTNAPVDPYAAAFGQGLFITNSSANADAAGEVVLTNEAGHYLALFNYSSSGSYSALASDSPEGLWITSDLVGGASLHLVSGKASVNPKLLAGNDATFDVTFPDYGLLVGYLSTPASAPTGNLSVAHSAWLRANPSVDLIGVEFEGIHVQASKQGSHAISLLRGMANYAYLEENASLTLGIIGNETVAQINSGVSSNVPNLWGGELRSEHNGTGTVAIGAGAYNVYDQNAAGVTTLAFGARNYVNAAAGTITTAIGTESSVLAGGTVTTGYGFKAPGTGGTTAYDFYATQNAGAGKWAFYGNGTAASHFGGAVDAAAITGTGVLTMGSGPTTITDAAGKVLSAALNTVVVGQGGTGLTAGTSGGIPYFSSTSAIASSAALAANALVIGGGAGVAPSTTTTGTGILTFLGTPSGANLATALTTALPETKGGTNQTSYTTGDILYASASNTLSKLADVAAGSFLRSGGTSTAPAWSTLVMPNAITSGGVFYGSAANTAASSGALTSNAMVKGGGAGGAPTSGQITDDGTTITLPGTTVNVSATTLQRSGNTVLLARRFTTTYDPASLNGATAREDTVTVTGITTAGGAVAMNLPTAMPAGCVVANIYASAADTVKVDWQNTNTVTACDVASSTAVFTQAQ